MKFYEMIDDIFEDSLETDASKEIRVDKKEKLDGQKERQDKEKETFKKVTDRRKDKFKKDAKDYKVKAKRLRPPGAKSLK